MFKRSQHFIMIKGLIHQETITIINIYAPDKRSSIYMGKTDKIVQVNGPSSNNRDLYNSLSITDTTSRQKINNNKENWNNAINRIALIDIYRILQRIATEYTFFSSTHRAFSKKGHMLSHKPSLNKCEMIEIIWNMFANRNGMQLQINNRKFGKITHVEIKHHTPE